MDSIISQNNQATEDIFAHHVLPYFLYKDIQCSSKINQTVEEHSYQTRINNIEESVEEMFIKHHKNIIGYFIEITNPIKGSDWNPLKFPKMNSLKLMYQLFMNGECFVHLKNLQYLSLDYCLSIDGNYIGSLINLVELEIIVSGCNITKEILKKLIHLKKLTIRCCGNLNENLFEDMIQLEILEIHTCKNFTDKSIKKLINLKKLHVFYYKDTVNTFTDDAIKDLINLELLKIYNCPKITDESIQKLIKLKNLDISNSKNITDKSIKMLTNLNKLSIRYNNKISDESIEKLVNLRFLEIICCDNITPKSICKLPHLIKFEQERCMKFNRKHYRIN